MLPHYLKTYLLNTKLDIYIKEGIFDKLQDSQVCGRCYQTY